MADQVTNYQCPACTGPLHFDGKIGKLKCDYCGSTFTVEEIEKLYKAKNESAAAAKEEADKKAEKEAAEAAALEQEMQAAQSASAGAESAGIGAPASGTGTAASAAAASGGTQAGATSAYASSHSSHSSYSSAANAGPASSAAASSGPASASASSGPASAPSGPTSASASAQDSSGWGKDAAKMRAYNCTSCGAELICDETTAATSCPYCGNNTIIPGTFAGTQRPEWVIPFKSEKKDAVNALKSYYKGKVLLPGSFSNNNHLEEIKGVYVPFWLYSGHVDARGRYEARKDQIFRQGEYQITRSEHYSVDREGTISFTRIPVDASTKMPNDLMDSIEPFDYRAITEFSLSYMPGFLANKYDVSSKECGKRAGERARKTAEDALRDTVRGYSSVSTAAHEEKIYNEKTEYAVLPVWLLSTKWEGQNFLFAMNGQTGKMIGNLPIARMKLLLISVMTFILSMLVFGSFMIGGEEADTTSYLITAVFAMVLTMIVNAVLIAQMKPVAQEARAAAYISLGGIELSRRNDTYIRTTESRTRIQNAQPRGGGDGGGQH